MVMMIVIMVMMVFMLMLMAVIMSMSVGMDPQLLMPSAALLLDQSSYTLDVGAH